MSSRLPEHLLSHLPENRAPWVHTIDPQRIPVLHATAQAMAGWREKADRADANGLADTILRDPLMTLRVLTHVSQKLGDRLATPVETVTAGLVLTGIEPFFNHFRELPTLEDRLKDEPEALHGALLAIDRSHRAARLAAAFAVYRQDEDAEVLHQAALLDNFAGLLVWYEAPMHALEMQHRQQGDPTLRSADVQRQVLGLELATLEQALMAQWKLPPFLRNMTDALHAGKPGPHSVMLAVRIARHSQHGWDNAALPDDYAELGTLLNMPAANAQELVQAVEG